MAAFAKQKKPTFLFLRLQRFTCEVACFSEIHATFRRKFSPATYELLGIFEWKCGGGLADAAETAYIHARGRTRGPPYIHTQSFTMHSGMV